MMDQFEKEERQTQKTFELDRGVTVELDLSKSSNTKEEWLHRSSSQTSTVDGDDADDKSPSWY